VNELVFFYGTLMSRFRREGWTLLDGKLEPVGRGSIGAVLYDLGIYPAAIPTSDSRVKGELHRMLDVNQVLTVLDEIEGYSVTDPVASLYRREETSIRLDDGTMMSAWVYFYNAPLGAAQRIASGDYLEHLNLT
jgi:gamma-glutamylcyclotransferase (GGCT)/AIG2-like uncharacterized protein YtfP